MKNIVAVLILLLCQEVFVVASSRRPHISFGDIEKSVADGSYDILMIRISEGQNLTTEEYALLYYGSSFADGYSNDMPPLVEMLIMEMTRSEDYDSAWQLCREYLEEFPFSMYALNLAVFLADARQDHPAADNYFGLSENILKVIEASGDGSAENPFQIVLFADILYYLEYQIGVADVGSYEQTGERTVSVDYKAYSGETGRLTFAQDLCRRND